ncbi:MAG: ABC-F family ATP-binding cassette domain-containing protein [Sulfurospirillaceae bacterium]|nr:ABC-F family ATP-binding cassette domain-containing protein [Sulfurospirillaceae bacterium]
MIQVNNLGKKFGATVLLEGVSFVLSRGDRVGLVGRNGSGKSTLFKMLTGEEEHDEGEILTPKNYRIGTLNQHIKFTQKTVREECALALSHEEQYDVYKVEKMLFGLGFTQEDLDKDPLSFSGGYQIRMNLAKLLVQNPNLLLLDEPTNYLDIVSIRWLKSFLCEFKGEVILITHDRDFMNAVSTHTMGIVRKGLKIIKGDTEKFYTQLKDEDEKYEKTKANLDKKREELEDFIVRQKARASKAVMAQSKAKQLEKLGTMDELESDANLNFSFNYKNTPAKIIFEAKELAFGYEPLQPLFENLSFSLEKGKCLGIIGKNGKGKSTLLNCLSGELKLGCGEIYFHPETRFAHFGQTNIQRLDEKRTIIDEVQSADKKLPIANVRSICGTMMFSGDDAKKEIKVLSGGERSRVMLGKIIATPANLLFLDEPTNHLDMQSIDSLCDAIERFEGSVVLVTHSEMLLRRLADTLVVFGKEGVFYFDDNYDTFLEKIGWGDEEVEVSQKKPEKSSFKEQKKLRAELVNERSQKLAPLKKEIAFCEEKIIKLEESLKFKNDALVKASNDADLDKIQTFSKEISALQSELEKLYDRFEFAHEEHDRLNEFYEKEMSGL